MKEVTVPAVLVENLREALGKDIAPLPLGKLVMMMGTEAAQPLIALFNAASDVVKVADGEPSATLARHLAEHPEQ